MPDIVGYLLWLLIGAATIVVAGAVLVAIRIHFFPPHTVEFWPNGRVRQRGPSYYGDRQEHWTFWHADGWKQCAGDYLAGFADGVWTFFHPDGRPCARGEMDGWTRRGDWMFWDDEGCPIGEAEFLARYVASPQWQDISRSNGFPDAVQ